MKQRIVITALTAGMLIEAGALYRQQQQIGVISSELYGQPNPLTVWDTPVPERINTVEDLVQVTARLCELSGDKSCAVELGMKEEKR